MIQTADIGIGVIGNEGREAVNNSDYAIAKFQYLKRLIFIHGRLSYKRNSKLILYSFYKNITMAFIQLYFTIYSNYSGQEIFDGLFISTFNLIFTSWPILIVSMFSKEFKHIDSYQSYGYILHQRAIHNHSYNTSHFISWIYSSIIHSMLLFYLAYYSLATSSMYLSGTMLFTYALIMVTMKLLLITNWNYILIFVVLASIVTWFIFLKYIYSNFITNGLGLWLQLQNNLEFWLFIPFFIVMAFLLDLIWFGYYKIWKKDLYIKHYLQLQNK